VMVSARSLFEAAALGLRAFRDATLIYCQPGIGTVLEVAVNHPGEAHQITVKKLHAWLIGSSKSPREESLKLRLRETLNISGAGGATSAVGCLWHNRQRRLMRNEPCRKPFSPEYSLPWLMLTRCHGKLKVFISCQCRFATTACCFSSSESERTMAAQELATAEIN
jgi:hypothetical protein